MDKKHNYRRDSHKPGGNYPFLIRIAVISIRFMINRTQVNICIHTAEMIFFVPIVLKFPPFGFADYSIQTYIAVRVGGKNDPAETTGLAHYFEHLMFKGTKQFGTKNDTLEEPLLDQIEKLFEVYRKTTDESQRKNLYHIIDSLSYEASKLSIPKEYDKLMSAIGANETNAYTSYDMTVYVEDIPSNSTQ